MTLTLDVIRRRVTHALLALAFLHAPMLAVVSWLRDTDNLMPALSALVFAVAGLAIYARCGIALATRLALALVLIGQVSILTYSFAGHPWQQDMHMYYFAVLALLAGFCDWRPIALGAAVTALHHLGLQYALPAAVFYQGGSLLRVLLHAVIVVIETAFLATFAHLMERMFATNEAALLQAQETAARERASGEREKRLSAALNGRAETIQHVIDGFRRQMEQAMAVLDRSARAMQTEALALTGTSREARQQTAAVSQATEVTIDGIEHLSSASEQLAASIAEINRNVAHSVAGSKGRDVAARRASEEIKDLAQNSEDIGAVVEIIRAIAAQTNLLALNATIEAARGREMAVVANEVKTLSAQTAKATDQVSARIQAMQLASQRSLNAIREIVGAIGEVGRVADAIALAVHEQSDATGEIALQVRLSLEGANRSAGIVGSFEAMTSRTHMAAEQLEDTAGVLASHAQAMRIDVTEFCDRVAAA